jgi:hypothetical protein
LRYIDDLEISQAIEKHLTKERGIQHGASRSSPPLSSNAASTIERRFVSAILREVRVFINWRSFIGPLSQQAGRIDPFPELRYAVLA